MRWMLLALLAGCTSPNGSPRDGGSDAAPPADGAPTGDAAPGDAANLPSRIMVGPTSGTVTLQGSSFGAMGAGGGLLVGAIDLQAGSGTVVIGGASVPAAVYEKQPWPSQGYTLYQVLAVEPSRIHVLWLYCMLNGTLSGLYHESTDDTQVRYENASGTCSDTNVTTQVQVDFPAIDLPLPALVPGYTISGPQIHLDGAEAGSVTLGGAPLTVLVFDTVDCTSGCGTPGWTELHSLLWDPAGGRVCYGIFYLHQNDTAHVELTYSLTLPTLTDPAGDTRLTASWTGP